MDFNQKLVLWGGLPLVVGLIGKIFYGGKGLIYGSVGMACLELIIWAWNKGGGYD
jgi:hypothetical protein